MKSRIILAAFIVFVLSGSFILDSCRRTDIKVNTTPLSFVTPAGFPQPVYNFNSHPITEEGFLLGRKLFYDGRLSIDGNYACASCHQQVAAFTTFEHDRSHGYNHSHTLRNSPGLSNLAWYPVYRQDGSSTSLDQIYEEHITNATEMAENIPNVLNKLSTDTSYQRMFKAAFGTTEVTKDRMFNALSQFVVNLVTASSKYDKVLKGAASFTTEEQNG